MNKDITYLALSLITGLLLLPAVCSANVGSPLMIIYGGAWLFGMAQLGIIPIEAVAIKRLLTGKRKGTSLSWARAFWDSTAANLATSAIGLPFLFVFSFLFFIPYLLPFWVSAEAVQAWAVILCVIFLAISFAVSVWIEAFIACKIFSGYSKEDIKKAVFKANVASYIFLALAIVSLVLYSQVRTYMYITENFDSPSGEISLSATDEPAKFACFRPEIDTDNGIIKCNGKEAARWSCQPGGKRDGYVQDSLSAFGVTYFWVNCITL
ncbi:MAG: hypothetical protein MUD10_02950 [Candidatus Pacebacteria bacterium]|jgi:hypothetical protein|nr:hypothetical protein [Candidatus Paceibacterota bacterium]